mgnify:CR=1 FL=1
MHSFGNLHECEYVKSMNRTIGAAENPVILQTVNAYVLCSDAVLLMEVEVARALALKLTLCRDLTF